MASAQFIPELDEPRRADGSLATRRGETPASSLVEIATSPLEIGEAIPPTARERSDDRELPFRAGDVLAGRYRILEASGCGGMGIVYKAVDQRREEAGSADLFVAIKIASAPRIDTKALHERLEREFARAARLKHEDIVDVLDFNREGEHFFLVMEWLDGEPLRTVMKRAAKSATCRLDPTLAARYIERIAGALAYAHRRGVVHADVAPANVFVTVDGGVKLLDFGNVGHMGEGSSGRYFGTKAYASCEVIERRRPCASDDVFSLGCIAYELLTGQRPFAGDALAAEKRGAPLPPTAGFDPGLQRAIRLALRYRRDDRPSDANQFLELWHPRELRSAPPAVRSLGATAVWGMLIVTGVVGGIGVRRALSHVETQRDSIATTALENQLKAAGVPTPGPAEVNQLPPAVSVELVEADVEALLAEHELTLESEQVEELEDDNEPALEYASNAEDDLLRDLEPKPEPEHEHEPEPARETDAGLESELELAIEPPVAAVVVTDTDESFAVREPHLSGQSYWLETVKRTPPQPLESTDPVQLIAPDSQIARRAGVEGWVDVDFAVAPTGQPVGIEIVGAEPPGVFERSAVEAVMRWRFAQADGARHVYARVRFER